MVRKRYIITAIASLLIIGATGISASSASSTSSDSSTDNQEITADTVATLRLKLLNTKAEKLQKELEVQDKKRDMTYSGVAPETLEQINDRQDSICLDLRSQRTSVELEIAEVRKEALVQALSGRKK